MSKALSASQEKKYLHDEVVVAPYFQRSVNLRYDFGNPDSFSGFVCHESAKTVIDTLARQVMDLNQRAFTITGPYGVGKSSLLNLLGSALCFNSSVRAKARVKLDPSVLASLDLAFPLNGLGWKVINCVGSRTSIIEALFEAGRDSALAGFTSVRGKNLRKRKLTVESYVEWLTEEVEDDNTDGVLLIIDEMGKFLEAAAIDNDDLQAFQTLAESIARSSKPIVLLGALHQSVTAYNGDRLNEWKKVQGRFSDIPLVPKTDEVVELISKAVDHKLPADAWIIECAKSLLPLLRVQKPNLRADFDHLLVQCSPFHPVTACLLGPVSRKQYGQNERSVFSFLSSPDRSSFIDFLDREPQGSTALYSPRDFWDYLSANLAPAISASSDSHRWFTAVEAIERAEAQCKDSFVSGVAKDVAVLDLYKQGSGITPSIEFILLLYRKEDHLRVNEALKELCMRRVLVYRRHVESYAVYEGSDFDIEAAIESSKKGFQRPDLALISRFLSSKPIVAKRHYLERGTLDWLSVSLVFLDDLSVKERVLNPKEGFGELLAVLPSSLTGSKESNLKVLHRTITSIKYPVIAFLPHNVRKIFDLSIELMALQDIKNNAPELHGDSVARREVASRLASISLELESELIWALTKAHWLCNRQIKSGSPSEMASALADITFAERPISLNELINRDVLSTNAVKARKLLMYAMEERHDQENLGIQGFPAERGLYESLLKGHIHIKKGEDFGFVVPTDHRKDRLNFKGLLESVFFQLGSGSEVVSIQKVFDEWAKPPFGVRLGIAPVLLHALILANQGQIAIYRDNVFCTDFKEAFIDEFLAKPERFSLRRIGQNSDSSYLFLRFGELFGDLPEYSDLSVARALVRRVLELPKYTLNTDSLSIQTKRFRDLIKNANDPHKLVQLDLPNLINETEPRSYSKKIDNYFKQLDAAFPIVLESTARLLRECLRIEGTAVSSLKLRVSTLSSQSGDFRLDSFLLRLAAWDGLDESVEPILSNAVMRPQHLWRDADIQRAHLQIREWCEKIYNMERLLSVEGDKAEFESGSLLISNFNYDQAAQLQFKANSVRKELIKKLNLDGFSKDEALAIILLVAEGISHEAD